MEINPGHPIIVGLYKLQEAGADDATAKMILEHIEVQSSFTGRSIKYSMNDKMRAGEFQNSKFSETLGWILKTAPKKLHN